MDASFLGHHFYAYPNTEMVQCSGYAGMHLQLGSLAMGVMPRGWKDRGGVNVELGLFVPRGSRRRLIRGGFRIWPRGGPNGAKAKAQRANRTRDPNLGYTPPKAQQANCSKHPIEEK